MADLDEFNSLAEVESLRAEVARLDRKLRVRDDKEDQRAQAVVEAITANLKALKPRYKPAKRATAKGKTSHEFVLQWSDVHAAEVVSAEATNGANEYNYAVDPSAMVGVPAGGITRYVKSLREQWDARGLPIKYFACGHFHDPNVWSKRIFINSSMVGLSEYGDDRGYLGDACQLLHVFNEKHGFSSTHYIDVA